MQAGCAHPAWPAHTRWLRSATPCRLEPWVLRCGRGPAGFFQNQPAQFACINCDNLGDYYQEKEGETVCSSCPLNTRRYAGQGSGANRTSCMCREEFWRHDGLLGKRCFKCPEGGICKVTPSPRARSFVRCAAGLRTALSAVGKGHPAISEIALLGTQLQDCKPHQRQRHCHAADRRPSGSRPAPTRPAILLALLYHTHSLQKRP